MSKFTDRTSNIDFRINKSDWFVNINNPSSIASMITMSVYSATANIFFKKKPFISAKNSPEPPIKNRVTMVNNKSRSLQWPIINSASCTGSHTDRCLNKGLGGNLQWYINRGNVVSPGNEIPHQYSRIISSKTSHTDIHKIQRCQSNTSSSRQYCGLNIFDENGGIQNMKMVELDKETWEYLLKWGITITTEYLPSELNVAADWESRNSLDSSEWMLSHQISQNVCQIRGSPDIDLFASRLSHPIPTYVA